MALSILGALVSACAVPLVHDKQDTIFTFLAIARFFLGVGVGNFFHSLELIPVEVCDSFSL